MVATGLQGPCTPVVTHTRGESLCATLCMKVCRAKRWVYSKSRCPLKRAFEAPSSCVLYKTPGKSLCNNERSRTAQCK
jgi:hypothetical protein